MIYGKENYKMNNNNAELQKKLLRAEELLRNTGNDSYIRELKEQLGKSNTEQWLSKFVTKSNSMTKLKEQVRKLAPIDDPVLIFGETGTGKELLAHALQGDRKGAFVAINCAGLPAQLMESELFGHEKGSFTGAVTEKIGLMEEAQNGTIFLDEIGDLAIEMQAKLLRAIQEKSIRRVGAKEEIAINCRIVSATHRNLEEWVEKDKFREDLFYRISTFVLKPTPLRTRSADLPLILAYLDKDECEIEDYNEFAKKIDIEKLKGNVRSLQQIYRRFVVLGLEPHE